MNELRTLILQYFDNADSSPWFPDLGQRLANEKWATLEKQKGFNKDNYSTEACLTSQKIEGLFPLAHVLQNQIPIFPIPLELALNDKKKNIDTYSLAELHSLPVLECIDDAFEWLKIENSIIDTIRALVRNIHLLKLEDNEYDVSYSLPNIPFSIFLSIPSQRINNDSLRVAEAILHETMHLQLTLIEEEMPLVNQSDLKFFSPWKNEFRDSRGIIHALYVFGTIRKFIDRLLTRDLNPSNIKFLIKRKEEIENQMVILNDFGKSEVLTKQGSLLISALIR
ncbi:aKG-HExxH-type peptide beta-hydroxylase [Nitrosomonas sp. Is37]|uniref:aKG-HExxH-type peptide beta-hydroxylase n=1 Tax=Nitrosomonas sp. Is37 TaxID=3080535 RepID=UPI00294AFA17|nr:HEXXH motif-containing putative peptide modification protein [Nitrosomonas sp. Is37]MDV6345713.1 HEXXH motif-containing putative peptide modification protein [Nitrosomonas sp. Is37]